MPKKGTKKNNKREARPMPSLIFQNVQFSEEEKTEEEKKEESQPQASPFYEHIARPTSKGSATLLWVGVLFFTLIIALLWGWSFKIRLDALNWQASPEGKIVNKAQNEWNNDFDSQKKTWDDNKGKIQETINHLITSLTTPTTTNTTSTSPSSTPQNIATTTKEIKN